MRSRGLAGLAIAVSALGATAARGQSIDDGVMMPKRALCAGFMYMHDGWDEYWEGTLERRNDNVGTVTTQSVALVADYGVGDRLNVIAMVPYVWTHASGGTLAGMRGLQDFTGAIKYDLLETDFTKAGFLRAIVVAAASVPMTDYAPESLPVAIGLKSKTFSTRMTLHFEAKRGWFLKASGAYTWRDKVTLDRPSYFTDGQLFLSDEVAMPDVFSYTVSAGYTRPGIQIPISFSQQSTLGGGDIRRQDMPFSSNKMNYSKVDAFVQYALPMKKNLALKVAGTQTVSGRNVGRSTTVTAGFLYTFHF